MTEQPAPQVEWGTSSMPAPRVYANVVGINGGPFDVMLVFGLQQAAPPRGSGEQEPGPVEEVVRVSMSWGHAKSMIPLLASIVADYEAKFGEVPAPGFGESWKA